jgi:hypothetical protein
LEAAPILRKKNPSMQNAPRSDKDLTGWVASKQASKQAVGQ